MKNTGIKYNLHIESWRECSPFWFQLSKIHFSVWD